MRILVRIILFSIISLTVFIVNANNRTAMLTDTCVACHGEKGNSLGPAIPSLGGMSRNYLLGAMLAFKYEESDQLNAAIESDQDLEDVEAFTRNSTIMARIAKGYTDDEIKIIADHFSTQELFVGQQEVSLTKAKSGKKLHEKYCANCHEEEGTSSEGDTGVLAGQWRPYFLWTMTDYLEGSREMPKKMKIKLEKMMKVSGKESLDLLADYYASVIP